MAAPNFAVESPRLAPKPSRDASIGVQTRFFHSICPPNRATTRAMRVLIASAAFCAHDADDRVLDETAVRWDERGTITGIGAPDAVVEDGDEVAEVDGVVLPGLIDAHTHVCLSAGPNPGDDVRTEHPAKVAIRAAENLRAHLDAGVTTIRDVGGVHGVDLEVARLQAAGQIEGPEVLAAGNLICMTGGHACFLGGEADGADAVRAMARRQLAAGAALIKLIATGGVITEGVRPGAAQLTEDEMRAAVDEAHKVDKKVAAHAQGADGIENALRAGVDTIEHGFWLTDDAIRMLGEGERALVPTFAALRAMNRVADELPAFIRDKLDVVTGPLSESFARAVKAGVRVVTGTDAGTPNNPHGNICDELHAFSEAGLDAPAVWRAATSAAAIAIGRPDRGVLAAGKRADLIVVERAAFDDPTGFFRPLVVIQRGELMRDAVGLV